MGMARERPSPTDCSCKGRGNLARATRVLFVPLNGSPISSVSVLRTYRDSHYASAPLIPPAPFPLNGITLNYFSVGVERHALCVRVGFFNFLNFTAYDPCEYTCESRNSVTALPGYI